MSGHSVGHLTVVAVPAFAPSTVVAVETGTSPTDSPEPENLSSVESGVPPAQRPARATTVEPLGRTVGIAQENTYTRTYTSKAGSFGFAPPASSPSSHSTSPLPRSTKRSRSVHRGG